MCRKRLEEAMKADEVDQKRIRRRNERMTGRSRRADQNMGDDIQTNDEKPEGAKKEIEEENPSEERTEKSARDQTEHEDAVRTQKREGEEADMSEAHQQETYLQSTQQSQSHVNSARISLRRPR